MVALSTSKSFVHDPLFFVPLEQKNSTFGRVYTVMSGPDQGISYPSITRVLGAKPKPGLTAWRARVGTKEANRVSKQAINKGHVIHSLAEDYLNNRPTTFHDMPVSLQEDIRDLWYLLKPWIDEHITAVHAQEQDLYSRRLKVAGRMDLLATVDGKLSVVDFKNSRRWKQPEYVQDYLLQGSFYGLCVFEATGKVVRNVVAPIVSPDGLQVIETTVAEQFVPLRARINDYYANYHRA